MTFNFRFVSGSSFSLHIPDHLTVHEVKTRIHDEFPDKDPHFLKLVHRSQILQDSAPFSSTGVTRASCVVVIWKSFLPSPFPPPNIPLDLTPGTSSSVDPPQLTELLKMGFQREPAMRALSAASGNPQAAVDYLLSHPEPSEAPQQQQRSPAPPSLRTPLRQDVREMLERNPGLAPQFIFGAAAELMPERIAELQADPAAFVRSLGLDPTRFNLNRVAAVLAERATANRLAIEFPSVEKNIVLEILRAVHGDENGARETLREIAG
jgi:hypothetical protein